MIATATLMSASAFPVSATMRVPVADRIRPATKQSMRSVPSNRNSSRDDGCSEVRDGCGIAAVSFRSGAGLSSLSHLSKYSAGLEGMSTDLNGLEDLCTADSSTASLEYCLL